MSATIDDLPIKSNVQNVGKPKKAPGMPGADPNPDAEAGAEYFGRIIEAAKGGSPLPVSTIKEMR